MARLRSTARKNYFNEFQLLETADAAKDWEKFYQIYSQSENLQKEFRKYFYSQRESWSEWNFMQEITDLEWMKKLKAIFTDRETQIEAVNEKIVHEQNSFKKMVEDSDEEEEDNDEEEKKEEFSIREQADAFIEKTIRNFELTRDQIYDFFIELYFKNDSFYYAEIKLAREYKKEDAFVRCFQERLAYNLKNDHHVMIKREFPWFLSENIRTFQNIFHWSNEAIGKMLKSIVTDEEQLNSLKKYDALEEIFP
jgi:hypothetical protein